MPLIQQPNTKKYTVVRLFETYFMYNYTWRTIKKRRFPQNYTGTSKSKQQQIKTKAESTLKRA